MALRSLGSSLLAKASPGSVSRDLLEKQIAKPAIPGKGAVGTARRDLIEEPTITAVPAGSEKIISAGPGVQGSESIAPTQPVTPLLEGSVGVVPGGIPSATPAVPAAPEAPGRAPAAVSGGPVEGAAPAVRPDAGFIGPQAPVKFQAPVSQNLYSENILPSTEGRFSTRVSADPKVVGPTKVAFKKTWQQKLLGGIGKALDLGLIGSPLAPETGFSEKAETFGGQPTRAFTGSQTGNIQQDVTKVPRGFTLRSVQDYGRGAVSRLRSRSSSVFSRLRSRASSLFGKLRGLFGR